MQSLCQAQQRKGQGEAEHAEGEVIECSDFTWTIKESLKRQWVRRRAAARLEKQHEQGCEGKE